MSDDIGARLGIIHRAGCTAPTWIEAMPLATMMGQNPAIVAVADGKGGELFACRLCGRIQGQSPEEPAERAAHRGPGRPGWTHDLFQDHWRSAIVQGELGEQAPDSAVAPYFELLDGTVGVDPTYLSKLRRTHGTE